MKKRYEIKLKGSNLADLLIVEVYKSGNIRISISPKVIGVRIHQFKTPGILLNLHTGKEFYEIKNTHETIEVPEMAELFDGIYTSKYLALIDRYNYENAYLHSNYLYLIPQKQFS